MLLWTRPQLPRPTEREPRTIAHEARQLPGGRRAGGGGARASFLLPDAAASPGTCRPASALSLPLRVGRRMRSLDLPGAGVVESARWSAEPLREGSNTLFVSRLTLAGLWHLVGATWLVSGLVEARTASRMMGLLRCSGHTKLRPRNCPLIKSGRAGSSANSEAAPPRGSTGLAPGRAEGRP